MQIKFLVCSVRLSLFFKAHKGHQQVFEVFENAKNSGEREKGVQYLWNRRDLGREKKILKKREQQLRGKKGRTSRNRKYLVVGD